MTETTSIPWPILSALWFYDLLNAAVAALPPSSGMGWTSSPLMTAVYKGLLTVVSPSPVFAKFLNPSMNVSVDVHLLPRSA